MWKTSLLNIGKHRIKFVGVVLAFVLLLAAAYYNVREQAVYNQPPKTLTDAATVTRTVALNVPTTKTVNPDIQYLLSIDPVLFPAGYHYDEIASVNLERYAPRTFFVLNTRNVIVNVTLYESAVWFVYVSGNSTLFVVLHVSSSLCRFYLGGNYNRYQRVLSYYPQTVASRGSHLYVFLVS